MIEYLHELLLLLLLHRSLHPQELVDFHHLASLPTEYEHVFQIKTSFDRLLHFLAQQNQLISLLNYQTMLSHWVQLPKSNQFEIFHFHLFNYIDLWF